MIDQSICAHVGVRCVLFKCMTSSNKINKDSAECGCFLLFYIEKGNRLIQTKNTKEYLTNPSWEVHGKYWKGWACERHFDIKNKKQLFAHGKVMEKIVGCSQLICFSLYMVIV